MPPDTSGFPCFQLVESGIDRFRQTVPHVLSYLDSETIESILDMIDESIEQHGVRFAATQALLMHPSSIPNLNAGQSDSGSARTLASAYLVEYPGELASLVGPWVDSYQPLEGSQAGPEVVESLIKVARRWGVELVQAVIEDDSPFSRESLHAAGLRKLSSLYQMTADFPFDDWDATDDLELIDGLIDHPESVGIRLVWRRYSPSDQAEWIDWMDATYEQTADCPELNGLRATKSTLEGYLAGSGLNQGGLDRIQWWAAFDGPDRSNDLRGIDSKIVTAFMLNDLGGNAWELSYMGVVPEHRGRGLGDATLHRALQQARKLDANRITLAVDCRNSIAVQMYQRHSFQHLRSLEAWFLSLKQ